MRLEQLYPFPADEYEATLARYPNAREIVWCQEEPQNQGAWYQIRHRLQEPLSAATTLLYAGARRRRGPGDRHPQPARAAAGNAGRGGAARHRHRGTGRDTTRLISPRTRRPTVKTIRKTS